MNKYSNSFITLQRHLRNISGVWIKASLKQVNSTCQITGATKNIIVHHSVDFGTLFIIFLTAMGLEKFPWSYQMYEFDLGQRKKIKEVWLSILFDHGLGICLSREIHDLFHNRYGRKNIVPEHLAEFKENLERGQYWLTFVSDKNKWSSSGIPKAIIDKYSTKIRISRFIA